MTRSGSLAELQRGEGLAEVRRPGPEFARDRPRAPAEAPVPDGTRILHVAETLPGGIASYLEEIWPFQCERFGPANVRFLVPAAQRPHLPSIPDEVLIPTAYRGRDARALLALGRMVARAVKAFRPDIVHLHSTFAGLVGRAVLSPARRPAVVYCAHGWSFGMETSWPKRQAFALVERMLAARTDALISISAHDRALARAYGLPREKLRLVRNGIAEDAALPTDLAAVGAGPVRLLFVGRHDRQKGLDILLEAMRRVPERCVHLDVLGESIVNACGSAAPPPAGVTFRGWVSRAEVARYLAAADAVVMPSRWEGFGLVAIEAMRAGRAVICSDRGALPEIIRHDETGYVVPPEPQALADVFARLDRARLREMGRRAAQDFRERFSSARMNAELLRIYRDVLARRGARMAAVSRRGRAP